MHPTHTPPTTAEMTPADILRNAVQYLACYGWHQGNLYPAGHNTTFPPADVIGAIWIVVCGRVIRWATLMDTDEARLVTRSQDVLIGYLVDDQDTDGDRIDPMQLLGDWNDEPDRTAAQVIAALTEAADDWDRIHGGAR